MCRLSCDRRIQFFFYCCRYLALLILIIACSVSATPSKRVSMHKNFFCLLGQSGTCVVLAPSAFVRRSPPFVPSGPVSLFLSFVQHSSPCVPLARGVWYYRNAVVLLHLSAANRAVSAFSPGRRRRRRRRRHSSKNPYTRAGHVRVAPDPALLLDPASARAPGNAFPNIKRTRRQSATGRVY